MSSLATDPTVLDQPTTGDAAASTIRGVATRWLGAEWDRAVGSILIAFGGIALLAGYRGVSTSPYIADQLAYLTSGGLGALALLALGSGSLVMSDLADESRKLDRIEDALTGADEHLAPSAAWAPIPGAFRRPFAMAAGGAAAGIVIVVVAYARAAGDPDPQPAIRALGLGVAGLIVTGASVISGLIAMSRIVKLRETRLLAPWLLAGLQARVEQASSQPAAVRGARAPVTTASSAAMVFVGDGLRRFHLPGCAAAAGAPGQVVARDAIDPSLDPCGLCEP